MNQENDKLITGISAHMNKMPENTLSWREEGKGAHHEWNDSL